MVIYDNELFCVTNGIVRSLRVIDKRSGATIKPIPEEMALALGIWVKLQKLKFTSPSARRYAEHALMHDFGERTIFPGEVNSPLWLSMDQSLAAEDYRTQGEMVAFMKQN